MDKANKCSCGHDYALHLAESTEELGCRGCNCVEYRPGRRHNEGAPQVLYRLINGL
jgi:hypothetical protein